jgi:hypothetical protein
MNYLFKNQFLHICNQSFNTNKGETQGSVFSLLLSNVHLEELLFTKNYQKNYMKNGKIIAFADDLLISAKNK